MACRDSKGARDRFAAPPAGATGKILVVDVNDVADARQNGWSLLANEVDIAFQRKRSRRYCPSTGTFTWTPRAEEVPLEMSA